MSSATIYCPDPHIDARNAIDAEIAQLKARIVTLNTARNALAPISGLHSEILQEIFVQFRNGSPHQGTATLLITWVSHAWRELAHNTSNLWTCIDFSHLDWVTTALSRSMNRQLEFDVECILRNRRREQDNIVLLALGHLGRMNTLRINTKFERSCVSLPAKSRPEWATPAPHLTQLELHGVSLPSNIFSGMFPCLQTLHLSACHFSWKTTFPALPQLKILILIDPSELGNTNHVVKMLRRVNPNLEELTIRGGFDFAPSLGTHPSRDRLAFNKLKVLSVHQGGPRLAVQLLNQLSLPRILNTDIVVVKWDSTVLQAFMLARSTVKWNIQCLRISISTGKASITATDSVTDVHEMSPVPSSSLTNHSPSPPSQTVLAMHRLNGDHHRDILNHFGSHSDTAVHTLCLEPPFLADFISIIEDQLDHLAASLRSHDNENPSQALSALARSIITFHDLRSIEVRGDQPGGTFITAHDARALRKWLMWRNRAGLHRLEKLVFSGIVVQHIDWLREIFEGLVDEFELDDVKDEEFDQLEEAEDENIL